MNKVRCLVLRYLRDARGTTTIVFSLCFSAILFSTGFAIDYSRIQNVKSRLQSDLDATVLGAAKAVAGGDDIQEAADRYFGENWEEKVGATSIDVNVELVENNRISGAASAVVPTTIMSIAGFESVVVNAFSEVELAGQKVEVSLVLDTTGSMAGSKLEALQSASKTLIDTAFAAHDAENNVRIGIVPFAQYVNVGLSNRNANWLYVEPDSSIEHTECRQVRPVTGYENCRSQTYTGYDDGVPYSYEDQICDPIYGPEETDCTPWTETVTWNGCVGSRTNPLDTLDESYSTKVPGVMNVGCGSEVVPLSNDQDALKSRIDELVATGDTYIPAGLMWGWTTLSPDAPHEEARGYDERVEGLPVRKILVLMTDGRNTLVPHYPYHHTDLEDPRANTLTAVLCTNIKAKGIEIIAVAFEVDDEDTKDMLRTCASSPTKFYDAPTEQALQTSFKNIAKGFTPLRITM